MVENRAKGGFGWYADRMPLPEGSRKVLIGGGYLTVMEIV